MRLSELAEAYKDVFPDPFGDDDDDEDTIHVSAGTQNGSPSANENVASTFNRPRVPTADADDADPTPSKAPTQPAASALTGLKKRSPFQARSSGGERGGSQANSRNGTRGEDATRALLPAYAAHDGRTRTSTATSMGVVRMGQSLHGPSDLSGNHARAMDQSERKTNTSSTHTKAAKCPMNPPPPSTTASAAGKTKAAPDHHAWFVKRLESDQRKLRNETPSSKKDGETGVPGPSFGEFAAAWRGSKPGGAFAKTSDQENGGEEMRQRHGTRLDVLGWEV